jgi:hypothetical protein
MHRVPMGFDLAACTAYCFSKNAVEFTTELNGATVLPIPKEIAARSPRAGKARVIVLTAGDTTKQNGVLALTSSSCETIQLSTRFTSLCAEV